MQRNFEADILFVRSYEYSCVCVGVSGVWFYRGFY